VGCRNENDFIRLWAHECLRVFQDRLIDQDDQLIFEKLLKQILKDTFNKDWASLVVQTPLVFTNFVQVIKESDNEFHENVYCEIVKF
jgi:dynein heavy chain, axonemal